MKDQKILSELESAIISDITTKNFLQGTHEPYGYMLDNLLTKEVKKQLPSTYDLLVKILGELEWDKIEQKANQVR